MYDYIYTHGYSHSILFAYTGFVDGHLNKFALFRYLEYCCCECYCPPFGEHMQCMQCINAGVELGDCRGHGYFTSLDTTT